MDITLREEGIEMWEIYDDVKYIQAKQSSSDGKHSVVNVNLGRRNFPPSPRFNRNKPSQSSPLNSQSG